MTPIVPHLSTNLDLFTCSTDVLFQKLCSSEQGLTEQDAKQRLIEYGTNEPTKKKKQNVLFHIISKFFNPLVIVLLIIGTSSLFLHQPISAIFIFIMALLSVILTFIQETKADRAAEKLKEMVRTTATVYRNKKSKEVRLKDLVPGDIIDLSAGDMVPADVRVLLSKDFFINQASLTGEAFPVEKDPSTSDKRNIAYMGSSVVSGTAMAIVIQTGPTTKFGQFFSQSSTIPIETHFDKGVKEFTLLMLKAMLCMVAFIFIIIACKNENYIEAMLFSLGIAVGLTPEMLPMIVASTLSQGAVALGKKEVIVKRLNSMQNLGAINILCTDKTGTLTLDKIVLEKHCDVQGKENEEVLKTAYINSFYQTGLKNVLDKAILNHEKLLVRRYEKVDEIPFDFSRKIMSVIIKFNGTKRLIAKGAPEEIFKRISHYELDGLVHTLNPDLIAEVQREYVNLSSEGFRVLAVAYKDVDITRAIFSKDDEKDLILQGYVAFLDPPKPTTKKAIKALKKLGITLKVLTGDNIFVTKKICTDVGIENESIISGEIVDASSDEELQTLVETTHIFARLLPLQKERIIRAFHANGYIVGYLGDGINDAPALKASDVGISVNNAVDIAKESADIILLKKNLMVLEDGVIGGRKTFGNIVKYLKMSASSNFGNMFSMTGASIFLPFLPMLPIQILLNNFLYDLSQIAIPTDFVDKEFLTKPRSWNIGSIKKFMLIMGPISSIFDYITFGVLLWLFCASAEEFHTGWFIESLCTQTLVIHIIRTGKIPFIESRPSNFLLISSLLIITIGFLLITAPYGIHFGFVALPTLFYPCLAAIVVGYLLLIQKVKEWFVKKYGAG